MRTYRLARLPVVISAVWIVSGCAFIDQKVALKYNPQGSTVPVGVSDRSLLVRIDLEDALRRKDKGIIIGNVKNGWGMKTADTITEDKIDEWIIGALTEELKRKGFMVRRVESFPSEYEQGVRLAVRRLWVEQDVGFWTVGNVTDLSLVLELYSKGDLVKKAVISAKGDSRSIVALSAQKEESLEKALRAAMERACNEIAASFGQ